MKFIWLIYTLQYFGRQAGVVDFSLQKPGSEPSSTTYQLANLGQVQFYTVPVKLLLDIQALGLESEKFGFRAKSITYKNLGKFLNLLWTPISSSIKQRYFTYFTELFFFFWPYCMTYKTLVPQARTGSSAWTVKVPSPIHWTTRTVPPHSVVLAIKLVQGQVLMTATGTRSCDGENKLEASETHAEQVPQQTC